MDGVTVFGWEPPRAMMIPDLGGVIGFLAGIVNPGAGATLQMHGRAYAWPRSEVIDLPQRTFWPYLMH